MNIKAAVHPLWAGFIDLMRGIFAIEIGFYLYYSLIMP